MKILRIFISNVATEFGFFRLFVTTRCKPCRKHQTIQGACLDGCCVYFVVWDSFISCFVYDEYHGQSKRYKWHIANVSI